MKKLLRKVNYRCDAATCLLPKEGVKKAESISSFDWQVESLPARFLLDKHPVFTGWYMLEVMMESSEQYLDCTLTFNYTNGLTRSHSFMVISKRMTKRVLIIRRGVESVYLSPSEKAASISIKQIRFVKLTTSAAYRFMHKKLLTYKPNNSYTLSRHLWGHYDYLYKSQHKSETDYENWIERREYNQLKKHFHLTEKVKFSLIIDILVQPDLNDLLNTLDSIGIQTYTSWDIKILATKAQTNRAVDRYQLNRIITQPNKISFIQKEFNESLMVSELLAQSNSHYIVNVEAGTRLSPQALSIYARYAQENPESKIIYSDHDYIDQNNQRSAPFLKSDWNPDLILSNDYIGNTAMFSTDYLFRHKKQKIQLMSLWVYRILIGAALGQDTTPKHISEILYHQNFKKKLLDKSQLNHKFQQLQKQLVKHNATAAKTKNEGVFKIEWKLAYPHPLVSIIIPTKDNLATLKRAIESILLKTHYENYEIIIINNQSTKPETIEYFKDLEIERNIKIITYNKPFNYSAINNFAVKYTKGELLLLLNDDIEVISDKWLNELVSHAVRDGVGCVGAKLLFPDDRVQHAGVIVGLSGCAGHSHKFYHRYDKGYTNRLLCTQNYSAVTAACLLVKKTIYEKVGGFNEEQLSVAFNDVDFCLKVQNIGLRNIWTPWAELYHYESLSRGKDDTKSKRKRLTKEIHYMKETWNTTSYNDPYYNKRLTKLREDFTLGF